MRGRPCTDIAGVPWTHPGGTNAGAGASAGNGPGRWRDYAGGGPAPARWGSVVALPSR